MWNSLRIIKETHYMSKTKEELILQTSREYKDWRTLNERSGQTESTISELEHKKCYLHEGKKNFK